jgi:hypothetical protein
MPPAKKAKVEEAAAKPIFYHEPKVMAEIVRQPVSISRALRRRPPKT